MLRLLILFALNAHAQDTDTESDGASAAELAGEAGGGGCDVIGGAGLGLAVVASLLAASRARVE